MAALCFAKNDTNLGRLTRSCLDTFPASREMAISKTFFAKIHSDRRIFHSDSSFFDAFFRLTLAHRCRLCQRRSPSHHLMAEAPQIKTGDYYSELESSFKEKP